MATANQKDLLKRCIYELLETVSVYDLLALVENNIRYPRKPIYDTSAHSVAAEILTNSLLSGKMMWTKKENKLFSKGLK